MVKSLGKEGWTFILPSSDLNTSYMHIFFSWVEDSAADIIKIEGNVREPVSERSGRSGCWQLSFQTLYPGRKAISYGVLWLACFCQCQHRCLMMVSNLTHGISLHIPTVSCTPQPMPVTDNCPCTVLLEPVPLSPVSRYCEGLVPPTLQSPFHHKHNKTTFLGTKKHNQRFMTWFLSRSSYPSTRLRPVYLLVI
jgi:hypothetical protein